MYMHTKNELSTSILSKVRATHTERDFASQSYGYILYIGNN